ncbi:ankyrin repeat domain-containing protein [archaeon]|nr:MAG: ankyrin repeat domain-containing protein [archaeon]
MEHSGPILVMIVAAGACLHAVDAHGETPLMHAVSKNFLQAIKTLIGAGAAQSFRPPAHHPGALGRQLDAWWSPS